jgi:hypothetical protein
MSHLSPLAGALAAVLALGACNAPAAKDAPTPAPTQPATCALASPAAGSAERKAILDALRPKIEEMTGKPVEFVVNRLETACDFARVIAEPRAKTGGDHYESIDAWFVKKDGVWTLGMIAAGEEGSDPAADQYKARYPDAPEALLYL